MPAIAPVALSLDAALARLDELAGQSLSSAGEWAPAQVFAHLAQSVEYSMGGFPKHKPMAFKLTAGALAFKVFRRRGRMSHPLAEAIPGAPSLAQEQDPGFSLLRLRQALTAFAAHREPLKPHFAFGHLSKSDYAIAHVLHLNNHLSELSVTDSPSDS